MWSILRSAFAFIVAFIVATIVIFALELTGHTLFPFPEGIDSSDHESLKKVFAQLPAGAILFVLLAYAVGTFVGAWLAAWLAPRAAIVHGLVLGAVLLVLIVTNLALMPHPLWFAAAAVMMPMPIAYAAARLVKQK